MFISLLTHALSFQLSFEVSPLVSLVHLQSTVCRTSFLPGNTWCHDQSTEMYQDVLEILILINWIWIWSDIAYDSVRIEPQNDAFEKRSFCSEMGILWLGVHLGKLKAVVLYIKFYLGIKSQGGSFKSKFNQCSLSQATTLESGTKMKHENTCSTWFGKSS